MTPRLAVSTRVRWSAEIHSPVLSTVFTWLAWRLCVMFCIVVLSGFAEGHLEAGWLAASGSWHKVAFSTPFSTLPVVIIGIPDTLTPFVRPVIRNVSASNFELKLSRQGCTTSGMLSPRGFGGGQRASYLSVQHMEHIPAASRATRSMLLATGRKFQCICSSCSLISCSSALLEHKEAGPRMSVIRDGARTPCVGAPGLTVPCQSFSPGTGRCCVRLL